MHKTKSSKTYSSIYCNSSTPNSHPELAYRPFASQPPKVSDAAKTSTDIEDVAFAEQQMEATGLEIQAKYGSITPEGQERLTVLQAKMDGLLNSRLSHARRFGHNIVNIPLHRPDTPTPIQPKLTIGEPGDKYEQETDETARQVVQRIHQPQTNQIQRKVRLDQFENELRFSKGKEQEESTVEATAEPIQVKEVENPNQTGLPDNLKAGVENLSGYSLDDVKVHFNSPKPAQLQALAYTQGTEIHVASGQEEHLPHEAWHVVQQMQRRVKPTMQMKGMVHVNDDTALEKEAEVMGRKAAQRDNQTTMGEYYLNHRLKSSPVVLAATEKSPESVQMDTANNPSSSVWASREKVSLISSSIIKDRQDRQYIPVVQRMLGDGIAIARKTNLYKKRSKTSQIIKELDVGTACQELDSGSKKWVKVKIFGEDREYTGFVNSQDTKTQPGIAGKKNEELDYTPEKFVQLDRDPFVGEPTSKDIEQGAIGDCWLLSVLASIVDTSEGKKAIKSMIAPTTAADSWRVRVFLRNSVESEETRKVEVTVNNWFAANESGELLFAQASETQGIWPQIIEKATASIKGGYENISGGSIIEAFRLVTGNIPKGYSSKEHQSDLDASTATAESEMIGILNRAIKDGKPVTCWIPPKKETATIKMVKFDETEYMVLVPHIGVLEGGIQVKYSTKGGDVTRKGWDGKTTLQHLKEQGFTIISVKLDENGPPYPKDAEVTYTHTSLKSKGKEIDGGHVYQFLSLNYKNKKAFLHNPHDTEFVTSVEFSNLYNTLGARFYIGDGLIRD
ncbi:C2 family cysteine protease [Nostoc sp. C117]|uniref:C2 family cysteine protease n=1 Tax=Nostoc sp. C117 TaxID=3349875 RepID=UPI00370DE08E